MNSSLRGLSITFMTALLTISLGSHAKSEEKVEDELKIKTASLTMPLSSSDEPLTPMGVAEHPGLCKYRGHEGKFQCINVSPTSHQKIRRTLCPGTTLHLTDGKCYECPEGYKRNMLLKKMTNPKACVKHQKGTNPKSAGVFVEDAYLGCPDGQFKHKGYCKTCPAKTQRKHLLGIDKGQCRVEKKYRCNRGLALHKAAPENLWNSFNNWNGLSHRKYCGLPFNLNGYVGEMVANETNAALAKAVWKFAKQMHSNDNDVKTFKRLLKNKKLKEAYEVLKKFDAFAELENAANEAQQISISVGVGFDASLGAGFNSEVGLAIDIGEQKLLGYRSHGLTKGISFGVDGGLNVGVWSGKFQTSYAQGYVASPPSGSGVDVGVAMWNDYYNPNRANKSPHMIGLSASVGGGISVEIGEYNEVWTKVGEFLECDIKSGFELDC